MKVPLEHSCAHIFTWHPCVAVLPYESGGGEVDTQGGLQDPLQKTLTIPGWCNHGEPLGKKEAVESGFYSTRVNLSGRKYPGQKRLAEMANTEV